MMAAVRLMSALPSRMKDAGWGRILNFARVSAIVTPAEMTDYSVPKTAPLAVSLGLAKDAAGTRVTANSAIAGPPIPRACRTSSTSWWIPPCPGRRRRWSSYVCSARSPCCSA